MNLFAVFPWIAFIAAVGATVAGIAQVLGIAQTRQWMRRGLIASASASLVTFLVVVALFILARVEYEYVFLYTSTSVPLHYRIAGSWAGREGSLLLWATYTAIVAAVVAVWHKRRPASQDWAGRAWTEALLAAIATAFLGAVVWQDMFSLTDAFFLNNRPEGNGLNPTLLSPFILIHPPVMFLAYALTAVPAAAVISDLITGGQSWSRTSMLWARIDWLLYTFAMGLGGIWAYYTLGFGGYWAWDPVEVANLLPWLALTVYLHAQLHHRRYGTYRHIGPLLAVLPLLLTIFSTISTRSGLWVSVHAFTDPTDTFDPDAASRFLGIMAREPSLQFHVGLFLVVFLAFLALWTRRLAIDHGRGATAATVTAAILGAAAGIAALAPRTLLGLVFELADSLARGNVGYGLLIVTAAAMIGAAWPLLAGEESVRRRFDLQTLALLSVITLGVGLLVIFLWHIAAANGWSTDTYLARFPYLATPVMLGLILFQTHGTHKRRALPITAAALALALVAALIGGRAGYLLVLALAVVVAATHRVLHAGAIRNVPRSLAAARVGLWLAALGNVVFWLNPPTIRLGFVEWAPVWPMQFVLGGAAFYGLHLATEVLCGRVRRSGPAHFIVGVLGGFYVAPIIAALAWRAQRSATGISSPGPRQHQVGLHGTHLAVALVLLGYVATTYLGASADLTILDDETVNFGGADIELLTTRQIVDGARVDTFLPELSIQRTTTSTTTGTLYWEPSTGSYFPLPATAREWDRDVYFAVDAICIDPAGECDQALHWIRAYESGNRLPAGIEVTGVQVQAFMLPGIALIWSALFLWLYFMGLVMVHGPERP